MTPLILTADEAALAAADKLTEIRRPVEPQPAHSCRYEMNANGAKALHLATGDGRPLFVPVRGDSADYRLPCPWGAPGELLYVCEAWGVGCRPCPREGWRDGIEYQADEALLEDERDGLTLYDVAVPDDVDLCDYEGKGWQPAEAMPVWASRFAYRGQTRVELAGGVWQWVLAVERVNREDGAPVPPVECQ
jgi:hypothetical protein